MWSECRYVHCKFKDEQKETETSHFTPYNLQMFQFYVLKGKVSCTLLQARVFIGIKVRKLRKKENLGMAVEFLSVTLFKLLHHGFTRYLGQLGKSDSYCILFDEIKVPNQSKSCKCLKFRSHSEFDLFLTHWVRRKNKGNDSVITIIISATHNLYELQRMKYQLYSQTG